ncbi:MAG: hypothetical protein NXI10_13680 [bacterium]|nr:hypothetical protein [bacterium]
MRNILFFATLFVLTNAFSQNIEVSLGGGLGNYGNSLQPNPEVFEAASFSPMAGVTCIRPWVRGGNGKTVSVKAGAGISYTHYKGQWNELMRSFALTTTGSIENEDFHKYNGNIHTVGIEITPIILTFWDRIELRSSLFGGLNVFDNYTYNRLRNSIITDGQTVLVEDGSFEEQPVEVPQFVMHSNSRVSFKIPVNDFTLSPFYQFSLGLLNEGESMYYDKIISFRHHFGLTFGMELD